MLVGTELAGNAARAVQSLRYGENTMERNCGGHTVWSITGEGTPPSLSHLGEANLDLNLADSEVALFCINLALEGL